MKKNQNIITRLYKIKRKNQMTIKKSKKRKEKIKKKAGSAGKNLYC